MKRLQNLLYLLLISALFMSCGNDNAANFKLKGKIKDLKKGTVYLQREGRSSFINLDSVVIRGQEEFILEANLKEPVLLYLRLQKKDGNEHYIPFFADRGITEINTTLKRFSSDAKINGTKQQALLEDYLKLMSDFQDKNLELIKDNFEAFKEKDTAKSKALHKKSERMLRLKYASTINFALRHNNSEVSPYLALYEIPDANVKFLDSIYGNLTEAIKKSYYGKKLGVALDDFKKRKDSLK